MSEWSEKDMDKLFQQGSKRYDFEFDPAAWENMEQLLDRAEKRRRLFWWLLLGVGAACVFFACILFIPKNRAPYTLKNEISNIEKKLELKDHSNSQYNSTDFHSFNDTTETLEERKANETSAVNNQESKIPKKERPFNKKIEYQNKTEIINQKNHSNDYSKNTQSNSSKKINSNLQEDKDSKANFSSDNEQLVNHPIIDISPIPILDFYVKSENTLIDLSTSTGIDSSESSTPKNKKQKEGGLFIFGLSTASEWNSIGFGDFSQQNWKFGLHTEYRFNKRLGVGLEATWMRMDYDAGKDEYIPESGFWVDGVKPISTFGRCDMLEIPITFNYYLNGNKNNSFYASAGISSYWILDEHYWYNYENPYPELIFYWGTEKDERNFFSLGIFSIGYQTFLTSRTIAQVEPYIQTPITGVGHGSVKIYSIGIRGKINFMSNKN